MKTRAYVVVEGNDVRHLREPLRDVVALLPDARHAHDELDLPLRALRERAERGHVVHLRRSGECG